MASEITGVLKIQTSNGFDTFEYRDMYNDVKTISFPTVWLMDEKDVEDYLTSADTQP